MLNVRCVVMLLILPSLAVGLSACSDSTTPAEVDSGLGSVYIDGTLNPSTGQWVLQTLEVDTPHGRPLRLQLLADSLAVDPDAQLVALKVSIRNLEADTLYGPAMVWLSDFNPFSVVFRNPDRIDYPGSGNGPLDDEAPPARYGLDYSGLLGPDGQLSPGETSASRDWIFFNPGLPSFTFGARAEFGRSPDLPHIAGLCWNDDNRNGALEPDETPIAFGEVRVATPGGEVFSVPLGPDGRYGFHAPAVGLYELTFDPLIQTFVPLAYSTPNPRQVLLLPGPDGQPLSFLEADFGVYTDLHPSPHTIHFTDATPDSLHVGSWDLIAAQLESPWQLKVEVGFSGCNPEQPFSLWMSGGFRESMPVQAQLVLVHEVEEDCDAAFSDQLAFDLSPLVERFLDTYGPGVILLQLMDDKGVNHPLELAIYPPD